MSEPELAESNQQPLRKRKIRTFRSPSGFWYFHIQADNNEVIAPSEGYLNKSDMLRTIARYFPDWEVVEEEIKTFTKD